LEVTVEGLNSYLSSMKENVDKQSEQIATLVRERAEMLQRMKEMEPLIEITHNQQAKIATLQQVSCVLNHLVWYNFGSRNLLYQITSEII